MLTMMQPATKPVDSDMIAVKETTSKPVSGFKLHGKTMSPEKIDAAANEFEAQFISQMLENMFATSPVNEELGGGEGEEMFRSLMVDEYGKLIARSGGIGVADHVKRELIKLQEVE